MAQTRCSLRATGGGGHLGSRRAADGGPQLRVRLADCWQPPKLPVLNSNFVEGQLWPPGTGRSATLPANCQAFALLK
jgi:hypothetical protein